MSLEPIHPAWKPHDKAWLKARAAQFKTHMQPRFEGLKSNGGGNELRFLKALYIKGVLLPYDEKWVAAVEGPLKGEWYKATDPKTQERHHPPDLLGKPFMHYWYQDLLMFHPEHDADYFIGLAEQFWTTGDSIYNIFMRFGGFIYKGQLLCQGRSYYFDIVADKYLSVEALMADALIHGIEFNLNYWIGSMISTAERILFFGGGFRLAFAFNFFRDLLQHADLDYVVDADNPMKSISFRDWLLYVMGLLIYPPAIEYVRKPVHPYRDKAIEGLRALFNDGVSPDVDALWAEALTKPAPQRPPKWLPRGINWRER